MAMKDRLTVCSLVPPVLFLATLLVGLGLGTFGMIADMFDSPIDGSSWIMPRPIIILVSACREFFA